MTQVIYLLIRFNKTKIRLSSARERQRILVDMVQINKTQAHKTLKELVGK